MGLEQESYAVDLAFDGKTGLDLAIGEEFDLIILDRLLPEMDGIEICREVRKIVFILRYLLTAKGQVEDRVEGLDAGADDYMVKPFALKNCSLELELYKEDLRNPRAEIDLRRLSLDIKTFEVKGEIKI